MYIVIIEKKNSFIVSRTLKRDIALGEVLRKYLDLYDKTCTNYHRADI